ncbi:FMN-binding protein [Kitasatospora atroaurantiaca]|uniref:FMN-binding protein n=1 Tax=Kitasatospora atroaurantiaca TaxID=285545 RepID=A0A561EWL3_9ACTN|nr:FMN-binding protein [Kitasatospora atroaurantiaca]TWE19998.1 FMN-binding protein [Kitasatospora atroaurantiaca]
MRRAVVTGTATVAGVILLLSLKPHDTGTAASSKVISSGGSTETTSPSASASASSSTRSITGSAIDTRYGAVQVKVTLDGTKITKIDVVQYPSQDHRDQEINSYALPLLNQEAIAAQSAGIDVISGATYTSDGYTRSLQSALDQAGL